MIDRSEQAAAEQSGAVTADGEPNRGWAAYLTLFSMETNVRPDGKPRIDLNNSDLTQLSNQLAAVFPPEWVTFIIGYRQNGPYRGSNPPTVLGATGELDLSKPAKFPLTQVLDLVGVRVQVQFKGEEQRVVLESPFPDAPLAYGAYLPVLMDYATVNSSRTIPGRININQASRTVLLGIPATNESGEPIMTEETVEEIISRRTAETPEDNPARRHETWILNEGIVDLAEMKALMPFVTAGGDVFRAQVVGYYDQDGPAARAEVVIDATEPRPRLLFWRDLTHLGRGYPLETLGIEVRQ
jgi:hypothetical protein